MLPSSNVAARQHSSSVPALHQRASRAVQQWFDTQDLAKAGRSSEAADRIDWARAVPFIFLHLACLAVVWVGVSRSALGLAALRLVWGLKPVPAWVAHKGRY
jgi:stearoyl-CoA desaturase (Delta-9 desaturase)